jgi:hypothetical protein
MNSRPLTTLAGALLASCLLASCVHKSAVNTVSSGANAPTAGATVLVPAGVIFYGKLGQPIDTKTSKDNDTFALDEVRSSDKSLTDATIDGHLENVGAAGPMRKPTLTLVFDDIRMPDGTKAPVNVQLLSTGEFNPKTHHLRTIGLMIGGAIAGHEAARRMRSRHGALLGAAGGYVLSQQLKTNVSVPAGSVVELKFVSPVTGGNAPASPSGS